MKLGEAVQMTYGVSNLDNTLAFYTQLGFQKVAQDNAPYPWALLTDGQNRILLNMDGNLYAGLLYFSTDAPERVTAIEEMGIQFVHKQEQDGRLFSAIFVDPNGLVIGLSQNEVDNLYRPSGQAITQCGQFGEFAMNVTDYEQTAHFWQQFDFNALHQSQQPYPWGIFSDEMVILGLHQTASAGPDNHFRGPALTYFTPDASERITRLKAAGVNFFKEGVLLGPDGEEVFIFPGDL